MSTTSAVLSRPILLLSTCTLFALLAACSSTPEREESTSSSSSGDLVGEWSGVCVRGAEIYYLELELESPQDGSTTRTYSGTARYQPFAAWDSGRDIETDVEAGAAPVNFIHDTYSDTISISLGKPVRIERRQLQRLLNGASGVVDNKRDRLAGTLGGRANTSDQFYIFSRKDDFDDISDIFEKFEPIAPRRGLGRLFSSGAPSLEDANEWLAPLRRAYPNVDWMRTRVDRLASTALPLFEDDHFEKTYGDTFDELSANQLFAIHEAFKKAGQSQNRNEKDLSAFSGMFRPTLSPGSALATTQAVLTHRSIRAWREAQLSRIQNASDEDVATGKLDHLSREISRYSALSQWPGGDKEVTERFEVAKTNTAYPKLKANLDSLVDGSPSPSTVAQLAYWETKNREQLKYVDAQQRSELLDRASSAVDEQLDVLLVPHRDRLANLGSGLKALDEGAKWHEDFQRSFTSVLNRTACRNTLKEFRARRLTDLEGALPEMEKALRTPFEALPPVEDTSAPADRARIHYCRNVAANLQHWFSLQEDVQSPTAKTVQRLASQWMVEASRRLPPYERADLNLPPGTTAPSSSLSKFGRLPYDRRAFQLSRSKTTDSDPRRRSQLPMPLNDAGFSFASDVCWAIFHGRFDRLAPEHYHKVSGKLSKLMTDVSGRNPLFHYAFVTYVGLSSELHGQDQVGPSIEVSWNTFKGNDEKGYQQTGQNVRPVQISVFLADHYESSYKFSEGAAHSDAFMGDGLEDMLRNFMDVTEKMAGAAFGDPSKLLDDTVRRGDGAITLKAADWEKVIIADVAALLRTWPKQSNALWQFQENITRHLEGRPSLQDSFRKTQADNGWQTIHLAALSGNVDSLQRLLSSGSDVHLADRKGQTALHLASARGSEEAIALLVQAGADLEKTNAQGETPLHEAAGANQVQAVKALLDAGANVHAMTAQNLTPLHHAAIADSTMAIRMLVAKGANIDAKAQGGGQPLHYASAQGAPDAIEALLNHGASIDARDDAQQTPLHQAAHFDSEVSIGLLVAKGADVNARNLKGNTPLHLAALRKSLSVIKPLVLRGADIDVVNDESQTPLDLAIIGNSDEVIEAIRSAK